MTHKLHIKWVYFSNLLKRILDLRLIFTLKMLANSMLVCSNVANSEDFERVSLSVFPKFRCSDKEELVILTLIRLYQWWTKCSWTTWHRAEMAFHGHFGAPPPTVNFLSSDLKTKVYSNKLITIFKFKGNMSTTHAVNGLTEGIWYSTKLIFWTYHKLG